MGVRDRDKLVVIQRHETDVLVFSDRVNMDTLVMPLPPCTIYLSKAQLPLFVNESSGCESVLICKKGGCELNKS